MKTLAQIIKENRIKKKFELDDLAVKTEINLKDLKALEESKYEKLPVEIYVKSYLQRIAKVLNLESESLYKIYKKEIYKKEFDRTKDDPFRSRTKKKLESTLYITPKMIGTIVIFLFIGCLAFYFFIQASNLFKPPKVVIVSPEDNLKTEEEIVSIKGQVSNTEELKVNDIEVNFSKDGSFEEEISLTSGLNVISIKAVSPLDQSLEILKQVIYEPEKKEITDIEENFNNEKKINIKAISSIVNIEIIMDGEKIKKTLLKDEELKFEKFEKFDIVLEENTFVEIIYNEGEPFIFPRESDPGNKKLIINDLENEIIEEGE